MEAIHGLGPRVVLMGRTEYQLVIREAASNRLLFNMTVGVAIEVLCLEVWEVWTKWGVCAVSLSRV
jgi:hypothetical protein